MSVQPLIREIVRYAIAGPIIAGGAAYLKADSKGEDANKAFCEFFQLGFCAGVLYGVAVGVCESYNT